MSQALATWLNKYVIAGRCSFECLISGVLVGELVSLPALSFRHIAAVAADVLHLNPQRWVWQGHG